MTLLPANLALTNIAPNASITSADHRTNYSAIQAYANAMNALLAGGAAGDVLGGVGTTLSFAKPPGYEYSYDEYIAAITGIVATTAGTAITVKTSASVTFDGSTPVWVEFFTPEAANNTAANNVNFELFEDATDLGVIAILGSVNAGGGAPVSAKRRRTPSAGAHTYTVKAYVSGGTGTVQAGNGGSGTFLPGFIRVTKA